MWFVRKFLTRSLLHSTSPVVLTIARGAIALGFGRTKEFCWMRSFYPFWWSATNLM